MTPIAVTVWNCTWTQRKVEISNHNIIVHSRKNNCFLTVNQVSLFWRYKIFYRCNRSFWLGMTRYALVFLNLAMIVGKPQGDLLNIIVFFSELKIVQLISFSVYSIFIKKLLAKLGIMRLIWAKNQHFPFVLGVIN